MPFYPAEVYPLSSDSKKIFCAYHETEFLTNFCQQKTCLMPLCPSCIAEHTQQHFQEGKKPTYVNINEALNRAKQSCYCTIITLQQYKKLNQDIYGYISSLQQNIHCQLMNKKTQLFQMINEIFNEYEMRLIKQIHQNYQEKNVYLAEESVNASKFIDEEITNLYEKISLLKGEDCLSSLITYYAVDQQNYKEALEEFDQYFEKNRKAGKLEISIVDQALKKFTTNLCDNLLSVECVIENFQPKSQQSQDISGLKSKRYGFNKLPSNAENLGTSRQQQNYQKENLSNSALAVKESLTKSRRSKQQIGMISHQERESSFPNQSNSNQTKPPFSKHNESLSKHNESVNKHNQSVSKQNESISNDSINRRKSMAESPLILEQDSKRLTRNFKKV